LTVQHSLESWRRYSLTADYHCQLTLHYQPHRNQAAAHLLTLLTEQETFANKDPGVTRLVWMMGISDFHLHSTELPT